MASNIANLGKVGELRSRLFFTLLILALYRIGVFIAVPGVSPSDISNILGGDGGLLGMFSMFTGGALEQFSIFALGVMPYISASIIMQLLVVVVPSLDQLKKDGSAGQDKINQYTRYGSIMLAVVQAVGLSVFIQSSDMLTSSGTSSAMQNGFFFTIVTVLTLTAGSTLLMWMGEQVQDRGIGNGISLIIFAGIVAGMPSAVSQTYTMSELGGGTMSTATLFAIALIILAVFAVIVFFERGQRRIPVRYAKKVVGQRMYGGQNTYLPLKINTAGVIPPIFASSILMFPGMLAGLLPGAAAEEWVSVNLQMGATLYNILYVALIIFFCFFYTAVVFNPVDVADNLKKSGGFIPGIRAGRKTAEYIDHVMTRITAGGAIYIAAVCVLPLFLQTEFNVPFAFGGTGLLIVVSVALDTLQQMESYLITHNYEGFGETSGRPRGRRSRR